LSAALLRADDVSVRFAGPAEGALGLRRRWLKAVDGVSLMIGPGETLGLVGESGSGKSTLGRALLGLEPLAGGRVLFEGLDISTRGGAATRRLRRETAMVFQDPYGALNPRIAVGEAVAEALRVHRAAAPGILAARVAALFETVGLDPSLIDRRPHALSGGQCQRVGIARALAVGPRLLVADECVAALDVSIQAQIVNLFMDLQAQMSLALIFIAHDLALVRRLCARVAVMYLGRIVEEGPTAQVFAAPRHPYTRALIAAIPQIDPACGLPSAPAAGEPPSPLDLPPGCAFQPRCPERRPQCAQAAPPLRRRGAHAWACVLDPPPSQNGAKPCDRHE